MEGFIGLGIWAFFGFLFGVWSFYLAVVKGKPSPMAWAVCGFIFNVIPIIALLAVHSRRELVAMMKETNEPEEFPDGAQL